jgi:Integrase zinc binding domain/Integrase core domain/Chromo (CHRromatin Organisation MOdifier) domain
MQAGYSKDEHVSISLLQTMHLRIDSYGFHWTSDERLVIPDADDLRYECFESVHVHPYCGHYGQARTLKKAEQLYYWPNMARDIISWIEVCDSCQRVKVERKRPAGHLQPLPIPGRRWESVSMDFITDLPVTARGHDAIWVVVDRLSKMVHVEAITKTITTQETARLYRDRVFRYHGVPKDIVSDRDPRFTSNFWRELMRLLGVNTSMSTAYHPQTDGQTERANAVLEDTLRHFVGPYQTDWDDHLAMAEFAMNAAYNHSVRNTPFMLNFGQHPDDATSLSLRSINQAVNKFVGQWHEQIAEAKRCLAAAQDRMKAAADKRMRPVPAFKPGDLVLLSIKYFRLCSGLCKKLAPRFMGPFRIVKATLSGLAYRVELPNNVHIHPVFHVSALKPFKTSGPYQPPPLPAIVDGELEYQFEAVIDTRLVRNSRQYLVKWIGYALPTWEPVAHFVNCPEGLQEFWDSRGQPCPHSLPA